MPERYISADALLYPTLANQDTVVAEALHAGLPVIGIAGTGTEAMVGGRDLLTPLHSSHKELLAGLAANIDSIADAKRSGKLHKLSDAAVERATHVSWPGTVSSILQWYV